MPYLRGTGRTIGPSTWSATVTDTPGRSRRSWGRKFHRAATCHSIPRAREVGQSYFSSIFTTIRSIAACFSVILEEKPDILLLNGPGVCVPVVVASVLLAVICPWSVRRPYTVYMESFTCLSHLSLTGRLLCPYLTDLFTVHWRQLQLIVQRRQRRGHLVYIGCEGEGTGGKENLLSHRAQLTPPQRYAVATVGSTHFDKLVLAVLQPSLLQFLKKAHQIEKLYVQYGSMDLPASLVERAGETIAVESFPYRPHLGELLEQATLVITHAGAGTILECLQARVCVVVVPNRLLMSDHQTELATTLAAERYLFCVEADQLADSLDKLDFTQLVTFPGVDEAALVSALRRPLTGVSEAAAREGGLNSIHGIYFTNGTICVLIGITLLFLIFGFFFFF
ncbi:beta-1,4-N-acetylglucosaminyltransferase [Angomonas deanei]|nr:beta-1,4-N-acetylglucosaminyltransferase [Angomonas deanei]|eukprot:EPY41621.1 beta-1,4-N-acetylglucosaminyltransferase [Angomonas deanei]